MATANSNHANTSHTVFQGVADDRARGRRVALRRSCRRQAQQTLKNDQIISIATIICCSKATFRSNRSTSKRRPFKNDQHVADDGAMRRSRQRARTYKPTARSRRIRPAGAAVQQSQAQEQVALAQARTGPRVRSPRRPSSRRSTAWSSTGTSIRASIPGNRADLHDPAGRSRSTRCCAARASRSRDRQAGAPATIVALRRAAGAASPARSSAC